MDPRSEIARLDGGMFAICIAIIPLSAATDALRSRAGNAQVLCFAQDDKVYEAKKRAAVSCALEGDVVS